ncbi:hypothetical protein QZ287_05430 [Brevibacillus laterosporus]|nr:hypothetical protein [Brevibacillus laterosporus]MDN9009475.1 hypothetical protein [Brevibacillus laterosporus]MDO0940526.1 hypothetical protein [Brevibacillus laterosporus]
MRAKFMTHAQSFDCIKTLRGIGYKWEFLHKTRYTHAERVKRLIQELNEVWDLERPEFVLQKK